MHVYIQVSFVRISLYLFTVNTANTDIHTVACMMQPEVGVRAAAPPLADSVAGVKCKCCGHRVGLALADGGRHRAMCTDIVSARRGVTVTCWSVHSPSSPARLVSAGQYWLDSEWT